MLLFLCFQSLMNEVVHTSPTIGSNVEEIVVKNTHFLMWDIGGQESLRSSWNTYYSNTEVSNARERERREGSRGLSSSSSRFFWQLVCLFRAQTAAGAAQVRGRPFFFPQRGPSEKLKKRGSTSAVFQRGGGRRRRRAGRVVAEADVWEIFKDSALQTRSLVSQAVHEHTQQVGVSLTCRTTLVHLSAAFMFH